VLSSPAPSPARSRYTDPCNAIAGSRSHFPGGRTIWNRNASIQAICQGFGTNTGGLHINWLSTGMKCAVLAAGLGVAHYEAQSLVVSGACSGAEIAAHPGLVSGVSTACSVASDLLGLYSQQLGAISGVGCAAAGTVGAGLGPWLEGHHEFAVARDIMRRRLCLEYRSYFGIVGWHAVTCR
jgi:hypothetical protein